MTTFFLIAGCWVLVWALRSYDHKWLRRLGLVLFLFSCYFTIYLLTGSHAAGGVAALLWLLLPIAEIFGRLRSRAFPTTREWINGGAPGSQRFPHLDTWSEELEQNGYDWVQDLHFDWEETSQFIRIYHRRGESTEAAICFQEQYGMGIGYLNFTTYLSEDDRPPYAYRTTNLPLSGGLAPAIGFRIQQHADADSARVLAKRHQDHLAFEMLEEAEALPLTEEGIPDLLQEEWEAQLMTNREAGFIKLHAQKEDHFVFTLKGCLRLYAKSLRDAFLHS